MSCAQIWGTRVPGRGTGRREGAETYMTVYEAFEEEERGQCGWSDLGRKDGPERGTKADQ